MNVIYPRLMDCETISLKTGLKTVTRCHSVFCVYSPRQTQHSCHSEYQRYKILTGNYLYPFLSHTVYNTIKNQKSYSTQDLSSVSRDLDLWPPDPESRHFQKVTPINSTLFHFKTIFFTVGSIKYITGTLRCLQKEMVTCRHWSLSVSTSQHLCITQAL